MLAQSCQRQKSPFDLRLREASEPLHRSHLRQPPTWIEFMQEIAPQWQRYMREHDTPEHRLATKLHRRFTFDR